MIRSLKKAMAPVLSDVSVEWVFPESTEVLVSPVSSSCLFPGDRLVSYGVICDTSPYLSNPRSVSPWGCSRTGGCWGVHENLGFVHGQGMSPVSLREVMGGSLEGSEWPRTGTACLSWEPVHRRWCDLSPLCASPQDKRRRYSMMHSQESGSSVFFHSQEEGAGLESWNHSRDSEGSCPTERSPEHLGVGRDPGGESDTDTGQIFLFTCWRDDAPVSLIKLLSLLPHF